MKILIIYIIWRYLLKYIKDLFFYIHINLLYYFVCVYEKLERDLKYLIKLMDWNFLRFIISFSVLVHLIRNNTLLSFFLLPYVSYRFFTTKNDVIRKKTFPNKETFTSNYSITDEETQLSLVKKKVYTSKIFINRAKFSRKFIFTI